MLRRDRRASISFSNSTTTTTSSSGGSVMMSTYNSNNSNNGNGGNVNKNSSPTAIVVSSSNSNGGGGGGNTSPLLRVSVPDVGVCGVLSTRAHAMLGAVAPAVCYALAVCCFVALMRPPSWSSSSSSHTTYAQQQQQQLATAAAVVGGDDDNDSGGYDDDDDADAVAAMARTTNVLLSALLALCVTATFLRRSVRYVWGEPGRLSYARVSAVSSQLVPRTVRGRACAYLCLVDVLALPLCLALSVYRSDNHHGGSGDGDGDGHTRGDDVAVLFTRLGALFYPPPSDAKVLFALLFWLVPAASATAAAVLYTRHVSRERVDPYYNDGRRALTRGSVCALTWALLLLPGLSMASSALPCTPWGTLRFAEAVTCRSRMHRVYMCAALLWLLVCGVWLELLTGALCSLVGDGSCVPVVTVTTTTAAGGGAAAAATATTLTAAVAGGGGSGSPTTTAATTTTMTMSERRNDAFALELLLLLRWLVVLAASLSGDALRCGIVAIVASVALAYVSRAATAASSVAVLDFLLRAVFAVTLTTSVSCAVTQLLGMSPSYGLVVCAVVWLSTVNTHVVVYVMRWHTTFLAPRDDVTYNILLA